MVCIKHSLFFFHAIFPMLFNKYRVKPLSDMGTNSEIQRQTTETDRLDIHNRLNTDKPVTTNYRQTKETMRKIKNS